MKFYFIKLTHNDTNKTLYKFGKTHSRDILERFDSKKYPERIGYADFTVTPTFSVYVKDDLTATELENRYLTRYEKPNVNEVLGLANGTYNSKNLTGITEFRDLTYNQYREVLSELYALKSM